MQIHVRLAACGGGFGGGVSRCRLQGGGCGSNRFGTRLEGPLWSPTVPVKLDSSGQLVSVPYPLAALAHWHTVS